MKRCIAVLLSVCCINSIATAQRLEIVDAQSEVRFSIKNFGIPVQGSFIGLKGEVAFYENNLAGSNINVSVSTATVNTGIGARDGHLRKEDYFDVGKYPIISFNSVEIVRGSVLGSYIVKGTLSIKGIAKTININFKATKQGRGYLFTGEFTVNRRDFGVGGSSFILSDNVTVKLSVQAAVPN